MALKRPVLFWPIGKGIQRLTASVMCPGLDVTRFILLMNDYISNRTSDATTRRLWYKIATIIR